MALNESIWPKNSSLSQKRRSKFYSYLNWKIADTGYDIPRLEKFPQLPLSSLGHFFLIHHIIMIKIVVVNGNKKEILFSM